MRCQLNILRVHVDVQVARKFRNNGVNCHVVRRFRRTNGKAGALEEGRIQTSAEFIAIFNAGFLPTADYLEQTIPHFFTDQATPLGSLAMVQAQWGHTNHDANNLTLSHSLWLDDFFTLQMSWRSKALGFVNFTGSAATWRAQVCIFTIQSRVIRVEPMSTYHALFWLIFDALS